MGTLDKNQKALANYLKKLLMQNQGGGNYLSGLSSYLSGAGVGDVGAMPTTPKLNIPAMPTTPVISAGTSGAGLISGGVSGNVSNALRSALAGGVSEEYWKNTVAAPAMKTFEEDIAPRLREESVGPGTYWGGARAENVGKGYSDLADSLAAARGEMANQALNRQVTAGLGLGELETAAEGQKANFMAQNYSTWQNARSQDYNTWSNATGKGYADYLSARSQDYNTWQGAKTQQLNSYMDAYIKANPTSTDTINSILAYLNTPTQLAYQNPEYIPSAIKAAMKPQPAEPYTGNIPGKVYSKSAGRYL